MRRSRRRAHRRPKHRLPCFEPLESRQLLSTVVTVTAINALTTEGADLPTPALVVRRTGPTDQVLTVNLEITGTATPGADYSNPAPGGTIVIEAGRSSAVLPVTILDDEVRDTDDDAPETIEVSITAGDGYATSPFSGGQAATIFIYDDDTIATLTIYASDNLADASTGDPGAFTILRWADLSFSVFGVSYTVVPVLAGAAQAGRDFDASPAITGLLDFPGGGESVAATVRVDGLVSAFVSEPYQLQLLLTPSDDFTEISPEGSVATTVEVTPSLSVPEAGVGTTSFSGHEQGLATPFPVFFTIRLNAPAPVDTTVLYALSGTAETGVDYTGDVVGEATIPAGNTWALVTLPVIDDELVEGDETVVLTVLAPGSSPEYALSSSPALPIRITAEDRSPLVATGRDVVNGMLKLNSQRSGHGVTVALGAPVSSVKS